MSIALVSLVLEVGPESSTDRFVLLALANYADEDGECWPSVARLVKNTALCERSVRASIQRLAADKWIDVEVRAASHPRFRGDKRPNKYTLIGLIERQRRIERGAADAPRSVSTGCILFPNGVQQVHVEPSENHHSDSVASQPARAAPLATSRGKAAVKPDDPNRPKNWSREACEDWEAHHGRGSAPGGQIGVEIGKLLSHHPWSAVRPHWQRFCLETKDKSWAKPHQFRSHYAAYVDGTAYVNCNSMRRADEGFDTMDLLRELEAREARQ